MSQVVAHPQLLWFLLPVLLITLGVLLWVNWVWYGIYRLRKERRAEEARAEQDSLERSVLDTQVEYLRGLRALTGIGGPTQTVPAATPSQA